GGGPIAMAWPGCRGSARSRAQPTAALEPCRNLRRGRRVDRLLVLDAARAVEVADGARLQYPAAGLVVEVGVGEVVGAADLADESQGGADVGRVAEAD